MTISIGVCVVAFIVLVWLLRTDRMSLGLPAGYLFSLLLIHTPGALAHVVGADLFAYSDLIEIGIRFTAIGSLCFVGGVYLAVLTNSSIAARRPANRQHFAWFCLIGGWIVIYGLSPLFRIPSISAAVGKGSAIWMLGIIIGLRAALQRNDLKGVMIWIGALMVYPVVMLLLGGFLSYGSAAIILVCSALTISTRKHWVVWIGTAVFVFLSLSLFANYFQHRDDIREQVWGGAPLEERIDSVLAIFTDFEWLHLGNPEHLNSFDLRLNQNLFVGLAAQRIQQGQTDYLYGASLGQGLISLVPRVFWPDKPVFGGSPEIVARMTGLQLNPGTSFGVGNVMEFQINFGTPGVVVGFLVLGWLIGLLDRFAALAEARGDLSRIGFYFLPAVALIQPNGSLVELFSGSAAALVGAFGWHFAWKRRTERATVKQRFPPTVRANHT